MLTRPRVTAADLPQLQSSVLLSYSSKHAFMHLLYTRTLCWSPSTVACDVTWRGIEIPSGVTVWDEGGVAPLSHPSWWTKVSSQFRSTTVPCTQYKLGFSVCIASSGTLNYQKHELEQHWTLSSVSLYGCGVFKGESYLLKLFSCFSPWV